MRKRPPSLRDTFKQGKDLSRMIIIPAVDIKDGKCVRLRQGLAGEVTVYSDDPVEMALRWEKEGGRYLHVVDLDGAFGGRPVHADVIRRISDVLTIPVEVGGGLRTDEDVREILNCGVQRAIIGTRAFDDPDSLQSIIDEFGARIAVGIDARDGLVQVKGWVETTGMKALDLAREVDRMGVGAIIYTDTATDGMMKGTNLGAIGEICDAVRCEVIASGGVTTFDDVKKLKALERPNLAGVIVGKALYEGTVRLSELNKICEGE